MNKNLKQNSKAGFSTPMFLVMILVFVAAIVLAFTGITIPTQKHDEERLNVQRDESNMMEVKNLVQLAINYGEDAEIKKEVLDLAVENNAADYADGKMYGVTITFEPMADGNEFKYSLKDAVINKFVSDDNITLADCQRLCDKLQKTLGDKVLQVSETYRNTEYTIFISVKDDEMVNVSGEYDCVTE
jgi:hypothetical protein